MSNDITVKIFWVILISRGHARDVTLAEVIAVTPIESPEGATAYPRKRG